MAVRIKRTIAAGSGRFVLDVDFSSAHRRVALFGPSGSGKTLTLQAIAGLMRPDSGRIVLNDKVVFDSSRNISLTPQARRVAYLLQDYGLFPHLTVAQNICFGLKKGWRNPRDKDIAPSARRWIDNFELSAIVHSYPFEISGGQKQRVALARALAVEPEVLLLDEPLAALDAALRKKMRRELAALQNHLGIPTVLITHDPDDVMALADHVVKIQNGRITEPRDTAPVRQAKLTQFTVDIVEPYK